MIGEKMRKVRGELGVSAAVMAMRICATKTRYQKFEAEAAIPNLEEMLLFCRETGVSSDYLLGLEG